MCVYEIFEMVGYVLVEDERETCKGKIKKFFANYTELSLDDVLNDPTIEAVAVETDEIHLTKYNEEYLTLIKKHLNYNFITHNITL